MKMEHKRYLTLEEYVNGLRETELSERAIQKTIEHERAHFEKAIELGYSPVYALERFYTAGSNLATVMLNAVMFNGKEPSPEHIIHILLAPKVLSGGDLDDALRLRRQINKSKNRKK